jgi:hypothetical protein
MVKCPKCGGDVLKNGKYNGRQRYRCAPCVFTFKTEMYIKKGRPGKKTGKSDTAFFIENAAIILDRQIEAGLMQRSKLGEGIDTTFAGEWLTATS